MPEGNAAYWDYSGVYGEEIWKKHFHIGLRQSPINIISSKAVPNFDYSKSLLQFTNAEASFSCENKGNNVSFKPIYKTKESGSSISGGPLDSSYCFEEAHFHWGRNNNKGCEHEIDGQRYDAELHMVHRKKECSFPAAINRVNGLCVLGVLIEVDDGVTSPPFLSHLMKSAKQVQYKSQHCDNSGQHFNPYDIVEYAASQRYYTYEGSLTTPPLSECVRWIVFSAPVKVSRDDFECLQNIFAVENKPTEAYHDPFARQSECSVKGMPKIGDNYRSCCSTDGRKIEKSF